MNHKIIGAFCISLCIATSYGMEDQEQFLQSANRKGIHEIMRKDCCGKPDYVIVNRDGTRACAPSSNEAECCIVSSYAVIFSAIGCFVCCQ